MRNDGRRLTQVRSIEMVLDYLEYPAGSCFISFGKTRVLCAVSIEDKVPKFLEGSGRGWLTAEYSLLPYSTTERAPREATVGRLSGRTQEIRRFIGRALRPIFDLSVVGERTFVIDCDVIQADGSTRNAAVTGAFMALHSAVSKMMVNKQFKTFPLLDYLAAVSVGKIGGTLMLDLNFEEDSNAEVDMNLVMTGRGKIIEAQATAEKMPVTRHEFDRLMELGASGIKHIIELEKKILGKRSI